MASRQEMPPAFAVTTLGMRPLVCSLQQIVVVGDAGHQGDQALLDYAFPWMACTRSQPGQKAFTCRLLHCISLSQHTFKPVLMLSAIWNNLYRRLKFHIS